SGAAVRSDAHRGHLRRALRELRSADRREAVRTRPEHRASTESQPARDLSRGPDLSHRPLPGQGDGAEHPGAALRQRHIRTALERTVRGQYADGWVDGEPVPGYRAERGVKPDSLRETFVAMKLDIDSWRWAGTPFYLRTGKRLTKRASEIVIQFRRVPHSPFG